ncbi:MAG: cytochrome c biogenesis protein CcsA [Bacteroidales bacterium]|jgi:ABC-type transport system involved in cytochrome c biogenesis permease subunit|nr:cytochrome c biogenesis protein CcsA [Bacteroidales bacterium]
MRQKIHHFLVLFWVSAILILAVATFFEKIKGTDFVSEQIYQSPIFATFWIILIILGLIIFFNRFKTNKNWAVLAIYISLCLILTGALCTFLTSQKGTLHLRLDDKNETVGLELPFQVKLTNFEINKYSGTQTPSNFVSTFRIIDGNKTETAQVSMNRIFKYQSYRFYQMSYDPDGKGTHLKVNYDPYGIPITYCGYLLFILSFVFYLFQKKGKYRLLIKQLSVLLFLLLAPASHSLWAQRTISQSQSKELGAVAMQYNGRICPFETYCNDVCYKLYGEKEYKNFDAVQVVAGWIFYPEDWFSEPIFKIPDRSMRKYLHVKKYAKLSDFFSQNGDYKLDNKDIPFQKEIKKVEEKLGIVQQIRAGSPLLLFPQGSQWLPPNCHCTGISANDSTFIYHFFPLLTEAVHQQNGNNFSTTIHELNDFQHKNAGTGIISPQKIKIELIYNRLRTEKILFIINLLCALIAFFYIIWHHITSKKSSLFLKILFGMMVLSWLIISAHWITRWYLSGHIPLSNGYETLLFIALIITSLSLLLWKIHEIIPFGGFLLTGFIMLLCSIRMGNPQITSLSPVLNSPWLTLHVSVIMVAYACLGFIFMISVIAPFLHFSKKIKGDVTNRLTIISKLFLYPSVGLLAIGIITGSFWANLSWGSYWQWDPKEVWALITLLIYALPLHEDIFPAFKKPHFYHLYLIIAFLSLLMTYFGVNYFFTGLHSYSS